MRIVSAKGDACINEPEEEGTNHFWGVRVALAGFVADHISSGDKEPITVERLATGTGTPGAEHDFKHACRLAVQAMDQSPTPDAIRVCLLEELEEVKRMLQESWRAVEVVAAQLQAIGELTGERVAELVARTRTS